MTSCLESWIPTLSAAAKGPLAMQTVVVPNTRVAHALRRALAEKAPAALVGLRFVTPVAAATAVLGAEASEQALRPARIAVLLRDGVRFEYFDADKLRTTSGWERALAQTLDELEAAGLTADDLPDDDKRLRDLAALWRALDADAAESITTARLLREAAKALEADRSAWPFSGPTHVLVTDETSAALARFLCAIPDANLQFMEARPARESWLERVRELFRGRYKIEAAAAEGESGSERDILARHLFGTPGASAGRDGTVELEEHAGVESEVEAAADWVARRVMDGVPLEQIAVLAPAADPLPGLVADRLARLPEPIAVHVAGGLPFAATAGGARVIALVGALQEHLGIEQFAAVLPTLKAPGEKSTHLYKREADELATRLGTVGGHAGHPAGALEWEARLAARTEDEEAQRVLPAVSALCGLAGDAQRGAPLAELASSLVAFVDSHLLAPSDGVPVHKLVEAVIGDIAPEGAFSGREALDWIAQALLSVRVPVGRFGDPAVYLGTLHSAVALPFASVRIVGLAEGTIPSAPREDPVLPSALRARLGRALPRPPDVATSQLVTLYRVVREAGHDIVVSFARAGLDGTQREPSTVFLDVATALGRDGVAIPSRQELARLGFAPARRAASAQRREEPIGEAAWLERAAATGDVPPAWLRDSASNVERVRAARRDGVDLAALENMHQTTMSASSLGTLLDCPRQYLFKKILYWKEPTEAQALGELDPLTFGSLVHTAAETFYAEHGVAFGNRERTLAEWHKTAREVADSVFDEGLENWPMPGKSVREAQRARLIAAIDILVEADWNGGSPRRFVAVERRFGYDEPLHLGGLRLRGKIDRMDVDGKRTLVRDLKSGRSYPREAGDLPEYHRDLQIGIYGLVTEQLAQSWDVPRKVGAAYVYLGEAGAPERAFVDEYDELREATNNWLDVGRRLMQQGRFPPTAAEGGCKYCCFAVTCGPDATSEGASTMETLGGACADLLQLHTGEDD